MTISNLSKTSFGRKANETVVATDVYTAGAIDEFKKNPTKEKVRLLAEEYPGIPAEKLTSYLKDPVLTAKLENDGLNLNTAVTKVGDYLPPDVNFTDVSKHELRDLLKWAPKIKESVGSDVFKNMNSEQYNSFLDKVKTYDKGLSKSITDGSLWSNEGKLGSSLKDTAINMAKSFSVADSLIATGADSKVMDLLTSAGLSDKEASKVAADLIESASKIDLGELVDKLIAKAGDEFTGSKRVACVRTVLNSYRIPAGKKLSDYPAMATALIASCDKLKKDWDKYIKGGVSTPNFMALRYASPQAFKVLAYNERTCAISLVQSTFRNTPRKTNYLTEKHIFY